MCHLQPSDKGWLRQFVANPTTDQISRFESIVDQMMFGIKNPTTNEIQQSRIRAYDQLMGVVA